MGILSLAGAGRGHLTTGPILAGCPARTGARRAATRGPSGGAGPAPPRDHGEAVVRCAATLWSRRARRRSRPGADGPGGAAYRAELGRWGLFGL